MSSNQKAALYHPKSARDKYKVNFYRAGNLSFKLEFSSRADAENLAAQWDRGATQGEIAHAVKALG